MSLTKVTYSMIDGAEINVKDYGAVGDGLTDDSAAIRLVLDYAGQNSCVVYFPPGTYYVPTTIFLPDGSTGYKISGYGAILKGAGSGTGTIFETGAENFSTGGTSNWLTANEADIHRKQVIEGIEFTNCEYGLKAKNMLEGCILTQCKAGATVTTLVYAYRCFYMAITHNMHRNATASATAPCFKFEDFVNVEAIYGNSAYRGNNTLGNRGRGFDFDAGTSGLCANNNVAEGCEIGLYIGGAVYGALFHGWYLENNVTQIKVADANYKSGLNIDGFWFDSGTTALDATSWYSGEFGKHNYIAATGGAISATNLLNSFTIWLPRIVDGNSGTTEYDRVVIPATWSLNNSVQVKSQYSSYLDISGPSASTSALATDYLGSGLLVPRYYRGNPGLSRAQIPHCSVDLSVNGQATINTRITYDQYAAGIRFDFTVIDNVGTSRIAGWIIGTTVFRNDAIVATVTASDNSGLYRLVLSGFSAAAPITVIGGVRIV